VPALRATRLEPGRQDGLRERPLSVACE